MKFNRAVLVTVGLTAGVTGFAWHTTGWGQTAASAAGAATSQQSAPTQTVATPQPSSEEKVTTFRMSTQETIVDVTVTDSKGNPVHGLKQSDFVVKEDNKAQTIVGRSFREVGSDSQATTERAAQKLPPNVYTNDQPTPTTSAVNILLLDALNSSVLDRVEVKKQAVNYLKNMPKGTRVAVLGLSTQLRILQGFTSDPSVLIAAVGSKKVRELPSPFTNTDSTDIIDSQSDAESELGEDDTAAMFTQFENDVAAQQKDVNIQVTLEALNQIAAYVHGIKGRKNLIWFTDGIPMTIFPTGGTSDVEGITDYDKQIRQTTDLLNDAEISVYPVDARRLYSDPSNGADQHLGNISARTSSNVATAQTEFLQKKGTEQLSMDAVAEATGGQAYYNTNDLKTAVGKAISNGSNYYSFSYIRPSSEFDGKYHSIDVTVDRPKVTLGYRRGYNADDIQHNAITPTLSLATAAPPSYGSNMTASMGRGVPTTSQIKFLVSVRPSTEPVKPTDPQLLGTLDPKLVGKPLVRYDLEYSLPPSQLMFAVQPDKTVRSSLEFDIAAYDVYGKRITGLSQSISPRPITVEQYKAMLKKPLQFFQQIDLPAGEIFLRVGVLDRVSDKVGTMEIPLTVKKIVAAAAPVVEPGGKDGK